MWNRNFSATNPAATAARTSRVVARLPLIAGIATLPSRSSARSPIRASNASTASTPSQPSGALEDGAFAAGLSDDSRNSLRVPRTKDKDQLASYRAKRDFDPTSEPAGDRTGGGDGHRFVVQQHDATRLHWDLR